jgi:hypothetical protein
MIGILVQCGLYNQVIVGKDREVVYEAAKEWLKTKDVKVSDTEEWYYEIEQSFVYIW